MPTPEPTPCPRCGAPRPARAPEQLCPACLVSGAMATVGATTLPFGPGEARPGARPGRGPTPASPGPIPANLGGYRLLGLLGRGGMGVVYEAEQRATGRRVALKVLEQELDSPDMRQRFLREGRLAAAVSHPNTVYIFGTEEIEGRPVIAMEVAESGTLKDLLRKRGPLPVAEAVDAILDVVAGLEAAHAGGMLHRDVKPSNCFVSPDGSVKVGDFGLSVSTLVQTDTFLTASGVMLGTPSYAPPEQLRGDELDVRADIYSVGATLFTLLTGKAPFEDNNAVQVVAAVLDQKPKPVTELRPEVPAALAQVVARCLAKKPEHRFASHAALRDALLPFSSATAQAAPLGARFLAGLIDQTIATLPVLLVMVATGTDQYEGWFGERTFSSAIPWIVCVLFYALYHAVPEGLWGAAAGKAILRMRVARPGGRAPGIGRALIRVALALLALECGVLVTLATTTAAEYREAVITENLLAGDVLFVALWGLMFVTMRRRNGFANLMDLASGTRVVARPKSMARPMVALDAASTPPTEDAPSAGPFRIDGAIDPGRLLAAYDPGLRRPVWLRRLETPELASARRKEVARPGRLRWLQGVEWEGAAWDAFEAPPGVPLVARTMGGKRPSWDSVRHWLHDLAGELDAATRDGTLPEFLSIDHVWITGSGRAVLLDDPWPGVEAPAELFPGGNLAGQQSFLSAVATRADPTTVPMHARPILRNLAAGSFEKLSFLAGALRTLLARPAALSRARRAASIFTAPLFVLVFWLPTYFYAVEVPDATTKKWTARCPELPALSDVLRYRSGLAALEGARGTNLTTLVDQHLAAHYSELATALDRPVGSKPRLPLQKEDRRVLLEVLAAHPEVAPEDVEAADLFIAQTLPEFLRMDRTLWLMGGLGALLGSLILFAVIQLVTILAARATPGQWLFGFAVVDNKGERAGRLRLLGRWALIWLPLFLLGLFPLQLHTGFMDTPMVSLSAMYLTFALPLWAAGLLFALLRPNRGLQDGWTKSWLVPR